MTSTRSSPFKTLKADQYMSDPWQRLIVKIQNTQKEQFDRTHRAKDLQVLKVTMNKYSSFPTNKGQVLLTWLTGTVTESLGLWPLIHNPRPQHGIVYRRNRDHLKPICYEWYVISRPFSKKGGKEA